MTFTDNTPLHGRTITALFDSEEAANQAIEDLVEAGIPREHLNFKNGTSLTATVGQDHEGKGFWEELKDMFLPDEDRYSYAEGLRRGGYLVTVRTEDANYNRVVELLDREGSVDMDTREASWKEEGWQGYQQPVNPVVAPMTATSGMASTSAPTKSTTTASMGADKDEVISLYEEQLKVGKRDVSHGKVRLRSYVVETPVTEQVNLRSESVQVDRRPVNRPIASGDAMFQDRVIEAQEYAEEAVISKTANVTEEISLRTVATSEVKTVSDTVRHTEVKVEDERTGHGLMAAADTNAIREHMDVIASDGQKIGTVDHMEGSDRIKLAKTTSPDGEHHFIPLSWVDHVDQHVHLNKPKLQVMHGW